MATKLYPPQIEGSLPAFYLNYDPTNSVVLGADITVPFIMNAAVGVTEVKSFVLRLKTASSNSYLFPPIYSENFNLANNTVTFGLSKTEAESLNEGQFYKVQIAYCGSAISNSDLTVTGNDVGYFSTVGIIKCTSKPNIYINGLNSSSVNFFNNEFMGIYDQSTCHDQSEKVYSYEFIVYDENDEIYYTTGEQLHQSSYDTEYNFSADKVFINDFVSEDVTYSIQYKVITMNNLQLSTPLYKITNTNLVPPNKPIEIIPITDEDNGYITIKFKGNNDLNKSYYYIIDEDKLINEKDEKGKYLVDKQGNTVIHVIRYLLNYAEKITFLKNHSLFKKINKKTDSFQYYWDSSNIKPADLETENELVQLIGYGRNIIKNLSYKYIEDNGIAINESEHYIESNGKRNYLLFNAPVESQYYGSYILSRASDIDNYTTWFVLERFRLDEQQPSQHIVKDVTIEHGRKYKYSLQQYNIWGLTSSRIYSDIFYANFEDMYLYDGEKLLKIRYNPKIDSFKATLLEQKTDTIGGRFPFITRNGATNYKQFPIGGLISQELDENQMFIKRDYGLAHRHSTSTIGEDKYNAKGELILQRNIPEGATRNFHDFTDENILLEREFKLAVLDWLNDGNPKLFKSPYEGNYIVRLMQNSLSPINELGRLLHNFTSQAYEIAECNYENLVRYGFINPLQPSNYTGLWKTYNLTDPNLKNSSGDIEIKFDVGLNTFTIQDMMPGDIVYLLFYDSGTWEPVMIGITGSYTYNNSDRIVTKLKIHPYSEIEQTNNRNISGVIHCYYQGVRITAFDSIIDQKLMTIPGQQFIGYDPRLKQIAKQIYVEGNDGIATSLLKKTYERLQDYRIIDILANSNNFSYGNEMVGIKNKNIITILKSFEPGEILDRIKATIYDGRADKISLINIEQAKFTARNIVPVYIIEKDKNENIIPSKMTNGKVVGEDIEMDQIVYVATTPFGHPYKIDELQEFEMIDPFCIFQVFEFNLNSKTWNPIATTTNGSKTSSYYDPYYKTWLYQESYDPTIKVNYHWQQIKIEEPYYSNQFQENNSEDNSYDYFYIDRDTNIKYFYKKEELPIYTLIKIDSDNFIFIDNLGKKNLVNSKNYNSNFYKKDGINYFLSEGVNKEDKDLYYVKVYDTIYDLSYVQEKKFSNLKDVNSIIIGNGVIADLTFQIKVLDYYTEIYNDEVRKAKQDYLDKKNFYSTLMNNISIVKKSDYSMLKYYSLMSAYDKLLNGTNGKFLTENSKDIIQALLNNNYEKENLDLLKLYNVELLNEYINFDLLDQLIEYKNKYSSDINFGFNDLDIYSYTQDDGVPIYYLLNKQKDVKYTIIKIDNNNVNRIADTLCYQVNSNGEEIFYYINKKFLFEEYSKNHNTSYKDFKIAYQNEYNIEDISIETDPRVVIIELQHFDLSFWNENIGYIDSITDDLQKYKFNNNIYLINNKYYIINNEDISKIALVNNEEKTLIPIYKYNTIIGYVQNEDIEKYIEYSSDSILDMYKIQDNLYLLPQDQFNLLGSFGSNKIPVFKNEITISKWQLLSEAQKELLINSNLFISIEEILFNNLDTNTPISFYEEQELYVLSKESDEEFEGVLAKASNLRKETENLDSEIKDLMDKISQEQAEYLIALNNLNQELDTYNDLVYYNWALSELFKLLHFQTHSEIKAYLEGNIGTIQNNYDEKINVINRQVKSMVNLQNLIEENLSKIQTYEKNKIDATNAKEDLQNYLEEQIRITRGELVLYNYALYCAIKNVLSYIFADSSSSFDTIIYKNIDIDKFKLYETSLIAAINNYNKNYEVIAKNQVLTENYDAGIRNYFLDLKQKFNLLYEQQLQLIEQAQNYTDIDSLAAILNLYDDIDFLWKLSKNKEQIQFQLNDITYRIFNIALNEENLVQYNENKIEFPLNNSAIKLSLNNYTDYQISQIENLKNRETFWYRRSLLTFSNYAPNNKYYNTFIFYPLSEELDPSIQNSESNLEYYNSLSNEQQISVLEVSSKVINNAISFLNTYIPSYGEKTSFAKYIYDNYLVEGKEYSPSQLKLLRDKLKDRSINGTALNIYQNKIYKAASALGRNNENIILGFHPSSRYWLHIYNGEEMYQKVDNIDIEKEKPSSYYVKDSTNDIEDGFVISSDSEFDINKDYYNKQLELAQSLKYIQNVNELPQDYINENKLTSITALSNIGIDPLTNEEIIQSGLYKDYLDLLGINELELKKIILKQALLLVELYEQQIDNYTNKYNKYLKIYEEESAIFNSFNNSQVIDFYNDKNSNIEDIKMEVKRAWWNFLNLLDQKYTEERERGMYL